MIGIFIDGNVWNFLYERGLDLATELTRSKFGKPELDDYIRRTIESCDMRTDSFFGFFDDTKPIGEQRFGGFDVGRFASLEEIEFISKQRASNVVRPTRLQKHEADISLAARSFHSVVLTMDKKSPALRAAREAGGRVVWLNEFDPSKHTLAEFIKTAAIAPGSEN